MTVAISKSQVSGNSATGTSAAASTWPILTYVKLSKSIISGNTAGTNSGGGVYARLGGPGTGMSITGCTFSGNTAGYGGGDVPGGRSTVATAKTIVSGCTIVREHSTNTGERQAVAACT